MVEERKYWDAEIETMPREKLEKLQWGRLQRQLKYNYANVPFYRELWDKAGIKPDHIKNMDDFRWKVPTVRKDDLRKYRQETGDPWSGMLACPVEEARCVGTSTGTTGEHVFHPATSLDCEIRSECLARDLWTAGIRPGMRIWLWWPHSHSYGSSHGISGSLNRLTERLGVQWLTIDFSLIFNWSGEMHLPELAIPVLKYCKPNAYIMLTELAVPIMEFIRTRGLDGHDIFSSVKLCIYSAGLMTEGSRKTFREMTGVEHQLDCYSHGDLSLFAVECPEMHYCHLKEDLMLLEILDPETKDPVAPGERGELTWTDLRREAFPLCRWMSEDIGFLDSEPCPCGRTHYRFKCIGRTGWTFRLKGKVCTPYDVEEEILRKTPATVASEYYIVRYAPDMDKLILKTTYDYTVEPDEAKLKRQIDMRIQEALGVDSEVTFVKPEELPRSAHKVIHVVDEKRK
jgi:phenylacetate-CoA ligase